MLTAVKFRNFKTLKEFSIRLRPTNILVGPNNAGKSSVLDAFRTLAAAVSYASRRNPAPIQTTIGTIFGYDIPVAQIPIVLTNIHSDYHADEETSVTFTLSNGNKLQLHFFDNSRCVLSADSNKPIRNTSSFKTSFPLSIYSFPTLGPLEEEELLLTDEYVKQSQGTRRAHRMFRNIWYRRPDDFPAFRELVEQTWPGMSISKPELNMSYPPRFSMFCKEERVDRELCWAGFGFQIWLQLLTHLVGSNSANILVVDEPEIYLHPDLQHQLFHLLRSSQKQIFLATHSAEIVNEAEHDDIVLISRSKKVGRRITDIDGLQEALFSIGSAQNIHLARLSKGRKILFLEGDDYRLIRRLAGHFGFKALADDVDVTVIPIGGFTQRQRISDAAWTFEKVLKADISISAVLDRDYRCNEEIDELVSAVEKTISYFHVLKGKEIENYLLCPHAIARAVFDRLKERDDGKPNITPEYIAAVLEKLANDAKSDVLGQKISNRMRFFASRTGKDPATVAGEAISILDSDWNEAPNRLLAVPGKRILSGLNRYLQDTYQISITHTQIVRNLSTNDTVHDLLDVLKNLNDFAISNKGP